MTTQFYSIKRFILDERGPTAVEYAVMMMLIFLACIATIQVIGGSLADSFDASNTSMENAFGN